jgi:hypothetical protein
MKLSSDSSTVPPPKKVRKERYKHTIYKEWGTEWYCISQKHEGESDFQPKILFLAA